MPRVTENDPIFGVLEYEVPDDADPYLREMRKAQAMQAKTYRLQLIQNGKLKTHSSQIYMTWGVLLLVLSFLLTGSF